MAQLVKNLPAVWETWVQPLGWEDPLEKGKATHSCILAWRIPWTLSSMGLQTVRHNWVTFTFNYYIWYKVMAQFFSFACGYAVFLAQFVENTSLHHLCHVTCVGNHLTMSHRVCFWLVCSPTSLCMSVFMWVPLLLWLLQLCKMISNSGRMKPPALFFFLKNALAMSVPLKVHMNFRLFFLHLQK